MPYQLNPEQLAIAFNQMELIVGQGKVSFHLQSAGELELRSGQLLAADPFVMPLPVPFARVVPSGRFPVDLVIARLINGEERIAYARLRFSDEPVSRWEMATTAEQNIAELGSDEFFGFRADEGAGSFLDAEIAPLHAQIMAEVENYTQWLLQQMSGSFTKTRAWLNFLPSDEREENIVCFTSGWGEGSYPTFFGVDENGEVVAAVIDFMLIPVENRPPVVEPPAPPSRPWWKLW